MPTVAIYDPDNNLGLNFSLNILSLMHLRSYLIKKKLVYERGGYFLIVEFFEINIFHFE